MSTETMSLHKWQIWSAFFKKFKYVPLGMLCKSEHEQVFAASSWDGRDYLVIEEKYNPDSTSLGGCFSTFKVSDFLNHEEYEMLVQTMDYECFTTDGELIEEYWTTPQIN
jgi:hypothetical protein